MIIVCFKVSESQTLHGSPDLVAVTFAAVSARLANSPDSVEALFSGIRAIVELLFRVRTLRQIIYGLSANDNI